MKSLRRGKSWRGWQTGQSFRRTANPFAPGEVPDRILTVSTLEDVEMNNVDGHQLIDMESTPPNETLIFGEDESSHICSAKRKLYAPIGSHSDNLVDEGWYLI